MSASTTFARNADVVAKESGVSESSEEWRMSDNVMMHLFAQGRHVQARMTAMTNLSEIGSLVASRSKMLNFQMVLGCAVMVEWCYLRSEAARTQKSDSSVIDYYDRLGAAWDEKYEAGVAHYNAPIRVFQAAMDAVTLPSE